MAKPRTNSKNIARIIDITSLVLSFFVLVAVSQHVDHLSQLAAQLILPMSKGVAVKPDFQLNPIAPLTLIAIITGIIVRKKVSTVMIISVAIFASALFISFFGIHLAHPGVSKF